MIPSKKNFFFNNTGLLYYRINGILLIVITIIFFYNPTLLNIKLGMICFIIGGFLLLLVIDYEKQCRLNSKKMVFIMSFWMILLFIISEIFLENITPDIFFLAFCLGITAIRELTNELISTDFKKRLDIFIFFFFLMVIVIIINFFNI